MQQALRYAEALDAPFAFSSNGDGFLFHDRTGNRPRPNASSPSTSSRVLPTLVSAFSAPEPQSVAVSLDLTRIVRRAHLPQLALAGAFDE